MLLTYTLLLASVACDVMGQVSFKLGLNRSAHLEPSGVVALIAPLLASPWILAGVAAYVVEFVAWVGALSLAPLSFAYPVAALSYCGIVLACRLLLHEHISARRWLGTLVVAIGVGLVTFGDGA